MSSLINSGSIELKSFGIKISLLILILGASIKVPSLARGCSILPQIYKRIGSFGLAINKL